jgi:hypothetical protein
MTNQDRPQLLIQMIILCTIVEFLHRSASFLIPSQNVDWILHMEIGATYASSLPNPEG